VSAHVVFLAASVGAGQSSPRPRIAACLVAALSSWSRGGRVVAPEESALEQPAVIRD
jgi:hypothetical protein